VTAKQPAAPHVADSHDLIRVLGACVNNLKDVSWSVVGWSQNGLTSMDVVTRTEYPQVMEGVPTALLTCPVRRR
jgi:hypothetical protein